MEPQEQANPQQQSKPNEYFVANAALAAKNGEETMKNNVQNAKLQAYAQTLATNNVMAERGAQIQNALQFGAPNTAPQGPVGLGLV